MSENVGTPVVKVDPPKKKKANKHPDWRMTLKERFSYYIGDSGRLGALMISANFMTVFLLFQGINLASLASIILIVKIIDAVDDVVFGYFVDRIKINEWKLVKRITGEGKYLPWYRLTFALFPLATILFFLMPTGFSDALKITWFAVTYLILDIVTTLSDVPMSTMIMTLTDNVEERNHILKIKSIITIIMAVFLGIIWQFLISEHTGLSIVSVAVVSAIIFLVFMLPLNFGVKEHNTVLHNVNEENADRYSFRDMLNAVKTNKFMMISLLSNLIMLCLFTQTGVQILAAFYLFGDSMFGTLPLLIAFIPGMILISNADKIAKKFGRRNSYIALGALQFAFLFILYLVGYASVPLVITLLALAGLPNAARYVFYNFLAPDTIEYTRYKTGKDCSGIFYALNSFVTKATAGVSASLGLFVLGLFGWVEINATDYADLAAQGVTQPASALTGMWVVFLLIPAIGSLLSVIVMFFYKLKEKDAELMAKCNSGEITREECEAQLSRAY